MQPRYAGYLDQQQRDEIRQKVQRMINLLGSPEVAIDDHHSPKLYSRFLQGLLDKLQSSRRLKAKSESPAAHKTELHDARGAALLRQRQCTGCRLGIDNLELARIAALPAEEVVRCEECTRILVRTDESGL